MSIRTFRGAPILAITMLLTACIPDFSSNPLHELNRLEASPTSGQSSVKLAITPGALNADDAWVLSEKLARRAASRDIVQVLKFASYYKKGLSEPALAALEHMNEAAAKEIVKLIRRQRSLRDELQRIDLEEEDQLQRDLGNLTECEIAVATGQYVPLTGPDFCTIYDSGILDLLPFPGTAMARGTRFLARNSIRQIPRASLRKVPQAARTVERFDLRRQSAMQEISSSQSRSEFLVDQLLKLQWNVIVELGSPR
jgi:hypothetical protein